MNDPIREHMEVVGSDGEYVGTIECIEPGRRIRLLRDDAPDGRDHVIMTEWITHIDAAVHLNRPAGEIISMS